MNIQQAYRQLQQRLSVIYEAREAANIADMVLEKITGHRKIDRIIYKDISITPEQQNALEKMSELLLQHTPVQYAIGEAWFMGMCLFVNEHVLIPRPETEELVDWIVQDHAGSESIAVLDIGAGSGCISIGIKKKLPEAGVTGIDISEDALQVAKLNSTKQNTLVDFLRADILDKAAWPQLGRYDIIVSNPPYISISEQKDMRKNVLDHEPGIALFVPGDDVLLFYKTIARFSQQHLKNEGKVYVEINEHYGREVAEIFFESGFINAEIKKDMQGKDRMVKAVKC